MSDLPHSGKCLLPGSCARCEPRWLSVGTARAAGSWRRRRKAALPPRGMSRGMPPTLPLCSPRRALCRQQHSSLPGQWVWWQARARARAAASALCRMASRRGAAGVVPSCDGPGAGIRCSAMAFADGGAWRRCSLILGPTASPPAAPDAPGGAGGHVRSARCGNRSLIGQAASSWFVASDCSPPLPAAACSWLIAAGNQEVDPRVLLAPRRVRGPQQAATAGCVLHAHPHLHTDSSS